MFHPKRKGGYGLFLHHLSPLEKKICTQLYPITLHMGGGQVEPCDAKCSEKSPCSHQNNIATPLFDTALVMTQIPTTFRLKKIKNNLTNN